MCISSRSESSCELNKLVTAACFTASMSTCVSHPGTLIKVWKKHTSQKRYHSSSPACKPAYSYTVTYLQVQCCPFIYNARAQPAISHCSHLVKNFIFAKKCISITLWIFQYCFYYSFILYYCAIFYSLDAGFFQYNQCVKQLGSRSGRHFVGPDLGPNCLQRLSADNKSCPQRAKSFRVKYKTTC